MARVPRSGLRHSLDSFYRYLDSNLNVEKVGKVFYVDPSSGSDNADGLGSKTALATLTEGISKCTAGDGDVIIRMPGTETVTEPVVFDKQGITVISSMYGLPGHVKGESFTTYNSSATGLSAAVINDSVRLIGLGFAASDVSEQALLIDCEEQGGFNGGFNSIEYCRFATWNGVIDAGIRMIGGALNHIIDCEFDGLFGGFGTAAISMAGDTGGIDPFYPRIEGCRFMALGSGKAAIEHAADTPVEVLYKDNILGSAGVFLDNSDLDSSGIACNNWLGLANQAAAFTNMTNSTMKIVNNHYSE